MSILRAAAEAEATVRAAYPTARLESKRMPDEGGFPGKRVWYLADCFEPFIGQPWPSSAWIYAAERIANDKG